MLLHSKFREFPEQGISAMLKDLNKAAFILTTLVVVVLAAPVDAANKCKTAKQLGDPDTIAKYCKKGGTGGAGTSSTQPVEKFPPPKGSFVESCHSVEARTDGFVKAVCLGRDGWFPTSMNYSKCPNYSLTNINGNLVCGP
jgi:hypothetical protein